MYSTHQASSPLRRRLVVATVALAMAATLAACGSSSSSSSSSSPDGTSSANVELQRLYKAAIAAGEKEVTVYGPVEESAWVPVYAEFMKEFPKVKVVAAQLAGSDMSRKVAQEFTSGNRVVDVLHTAPLAEYDKKGWIEPNQFQNLPDLPAVAIGKKDYYYAPAGVALGIVYNKDQVKTPPSTWDDLLSPQYKGKLEMQDPKIIGGAEEALAALMDAKEIDEGYIKSLRSQEVKLVPTQGAIGPSIAAGDNAIGVMFPLSFYTQLKAKGAPLGMVFPVKGGNFISPLYVAVLKDAPHPAAARLLSSWLFSSNGAKAIANVGDYPLIPGQPGPSGRPAASDFSVLPYDDLTQAATDAKYTKYFQGVWPS